MLYPTGEGIIQAASDNLQEASFRHFDVGRRKMEFNVGRVHLEDFCKFAKARPLEFARPFVPEELAVVSHPRHRIVDTRPLHLYIDSDSGGIDETTVEGGVMGDRHPGLR